MDMENAFSEYMSKAPNTKKIHYWDLHPQLCVGFSSNPVQKINMKGDSITVQRLCRLAGNDPKMERNISFFLMHKSSGRKLRITLPLNLNDISFVNLYALMVSEGSHKTEFRLHVPEKIFHDMFIENLEAIFSNEIKKHVTQKMDKGVMRSNAPRAIRYFLPIPKHIPKLILENKEYCRRYLQIAFEAEGSPIFVGNKRYISLKRNVDVTPILENKTKYPEYERIYFGQLKRDYNELAMNVEENPPITLLGEHLMLRYYFSIYSIMKPEAIRINETSHRCGKISARWALCIYADSVNKFIQEIGFLSKRKQTIANRMAKIVGRRRRHFALDIMRNIQKNGFFTGYDFSNEMKSYGYVSPRAYIYRYVKSGLIKRIGRSRYRLLVN